jgi:hypothetical protein
MRLEHSEAGLSALVEEEVLPEQAANADARVRREISGPIQLSAADVEWLHGATGELLATLLPELARDAGWDRRILRSTDRLRAVSAVLQAALEWRRGGRAKPLIDALDALVAEGHALPAPDPSTT